MKIYIGPYSRDWGYKLRMWLVEKNLDWDWAFKLSHLLDYRKKRKIKIDIHEYDGWSLDHTLALIIVPALQEFKKNLYSYNPDFSSVDDWSEEIDVMIAGFQVIINNEEFEKADIMNKGLDSFRYYYNSLWN